MRAAIEYALAEKRKSVNLVHKGNIMKFTEGAFRDWGYALAAREFRDQVVTERESWILGNKEKNADAHGRGQRQARSSPATTWRPPDMQAEFRDEVEAALQALGRPTATASGRRMLLHQGLHRRHHAAAGAHAPARSSTSSPR